MKPLCPDTDIQDFLRLYDIVFGIEGTPEMWRWKYLPPWTDHPWAWAVFESDQLVGYAGGVPLRGWHDGHPVPFMQIGDVMVHPEFRAKKDYVRPATLAFTEEIHRTSPRCVIYGFTAHRGFLWYQRIGLINLVEKVVDVAVVSPGGTPSSGPQKTDEYEILPWQWDNPEIDGLWTELKSSVTLGLIRDGAYLRWRYAGHPLATYELYGVLQAGAPIGWIVVRGPLSRVRGNGGAVQLVDLLVPEDSRQAILTAACDQLRTEQLMLWLPRHIASGFADVRQTKVNVLHLGQNAPLSPEYLRDNLYYTSGDADWT
jgi:hypothetical protein